MNVPASILAAFRLDRFPPALFQTAGYALNRVASYVGRGYGQSWDAETTWNDRKGELKEEVVRELRCIAEQHGYTDILQLLEEPEVL